MLSTKKTATAHSENVYDGVTHSPFSSDANSKPAPYTAREAIGIVLDPLTRQETLFGGKLPFYSIKESRSRKFTLLWETTNGLSNDEKTPESRFTADSIATAYAALLRAVRERAQMVSAIPDLSEADMIGLPVTDYVNNIQLGEEIIKPIWRATEVPEERVLALQYIAREVGFALDNTATTDKYPPVNIKKNTPLYKLCEDIATELQLQYYRELDASIDEAKLQEHLKQMSFALDYAYNPESGEYIPRKKNIAVISGPPAAGKGTTGDILQLVIAASGTEGGAGRGIEKVVIEKDGQTFTKTRDEVADLDEVLRKRIKVQMMDGQELRWGEPENDSTEREPSPIEFIEKMSWYDQYEHYMRGFDRPRSRGVQIPNKVLTVMFADIMLETRRKLDEQGRIHEPIVLDGAPRNKQQAEYLFQYLDKEKLGGLFYQMISEQTAAVRTLGRAAFSFKTKGDIRADELVGIDFSNAPTLAALVEINPETGKLSDAAKERLTTIVEASSLQPDKAVQSFIQDVLATGNETLGMIPTEHTAAVRQIAQFIRNALQQLPVVEKDVHESLVLNNAPSLITSYFQFEGGLLSQAAIEAIKETFGKAESLAALEELVRIHLQETNERVHVKFDYLQGQRPSRYWQYVDWKYGLIDACRSLGMQTVDKNCDGVPQEEVAAIAKQALGLES